MAYTEVTRTGYGTRLKNSLGGVLIGLVMFIGGTVLLWWNEGRAVKTTNMLKDAEKNYVEMDNPGVKNPEFEGKLVHAIALATTADSLADETFGIGAVAVKLNRDVEYYQWTEHSHTEKKDKIGGAQETTTTYTYKKEWTSAPVNSSDFKDPDYQGTNFTYCEFERKTYSASNVDFGAYHLNASQIGQFHNSQPMTVSLSDDLMQKIENACVTVSKSARGKNLDLDTTSVSANGTKVNYQYVHVDGNTVYVGRNPNMPEVGDVRVKFTKDLPAKASILAKVMGDTFAAWKAKNGKMFETLYMGEQSAEEMFASEHATNTMITWLLRILGILIIIGGLRSIVSIVPTLLKVLPFLGQIMETGLGVVCGIVGLVWSLIVIAVAWLRYRPVLGITLLVIAGLLIFWLVKRSRKKKAERQAAGPVQPDTPAQPERQQPQIQIPQYQNPPQPQQTQNPPQMTEEQLKQFEQWKQFQEFQKMQEQMKQQNNGNTQ